MRCMYCMRCMPYSRAPRTTDRQTDRQTDRHTDTHTHIDARDHNTFHVVYDLREM